MQAKSFFRIETVTGEPFAVKDKVVRVQARAVSLRLPFGGAVWNRPVAVLVQTADGAEQRLAVRDITRLVQVLVLILGVAGALFIALARGNANKECQNDG